MRAARGAHRAPRAMHLHGTFRLVLVAHAIGLPLMLALSR